MPSRAHCRQCTMAHSLVCPNNTAWGLRVLVRTAAEAWIPCCQNHSSKSNPPGLTKPWGCFSRRGSRQTCPARTNGKSFGSDLSWAYQPSCNNSGMSTLTVLPWRTACETSRRKRQPSAWRCGRLTTVPTTSRSKPCSSGGKAFCWYKSARQPTLAYAKAATVAMALAQQMQSPKKQVNVCGDAQRHALWTARHSKPDHSTGQR